MNIPRRPDRQIVCGDLGVACWLARDRLNHNGWVDGIGVVDAQVIQDVDDGAAPRWELGGCATDGERLPGLVPRVKERRRGVELDEHRIGVALQVAGRNGIATGDLNGRTDHAPSGVAAFGAGHGVAFVADYSLNNERERKQRTDGAIRRSNRVERAVVERHIGKRDGVALHARGAGNFGPVASTVAVVRIVGAGDQHIVGREADVLGGIGTEPGVAEVDRHVDGDGRAAVAAAVGVPGALNPAGEREPAVCREVRRGDNVIGLRGVVPGEEEVAVGVEPADIVEAESPEFRAGVDFFRFNGTVRIAVDVADAEDIASVARGRVAGVLVGVAKAVLGREVV